MIDYCVVIADASRARFFTLVPAEHPKIESGPTLVERTALANAEAAGRDADIFSETRSGANRSAGGATHPYCDHRRRHEEEFEKRFAKAVACQVAEIQKQEESIGKLVLAASSGMLGHLRKQITVLGRGTAVTDVARDLTRMKPEKIHGILASEGLLPARVKRARRQ